LIPITKPLIGEAEAEAASRVILSGWTTQGPEVAAFEREFADYTGAPYACAVSNCTTALHLALLAVGVKPGDEVITVSHSYIATANVVRYCGALPVFVDIDPATYNLDPEFLAAAISSKTRAILCVHQIGMPCDLARITAIAQQHRIPVIEDAACAIGSEIKWHGEWQKIGRPHGDIACFSFHPRKVISTGDGGMITTRNADWDSKFRLLRQHGMSVPDTVRHGSNQVIFENYPIVGYNYRMTDIQAAVGREQLKRLPGIVEKRRLLAEQYRGLLASIPGLALPEEPEWARSTWQSFCVRLPERCDQWQVMQTMLDDGIATRRGVMCAHREDAYPNGTWIYRGSRAVSGNHKVESVGLRHSEEAQEHSVILPLYPQMTEAELEHVAVMLKRAIVRNTG
jgi:perosamine synthetase